MSDQWIQKLYDYASEHNLRRKVDVTPMRRRVPAGPRFSHAWAVGKDRTTNGSTVLVSDPQTPVRNPSLFYEFHIAGKTFNARGIGVPGSPSILIGFTPNVAWGLTALGADQADLFVLKTDPNRPNQYELDGQWLDMDVRTETIQVKNGRSRTLTVRQTCFGPVVTSLAMGIRPSDEVALKRIPNCEPEHDTFEGLLAMIRAQDVHEFRQALGHWRFPSANCVFGDQPGKHRLQDDPGLAHPFLLTPCSMSERHMKDGTAPTTGKASLPHELLPQVINPDRKGGSSAANHRPIASFYPISMGISTGSLGDTDRSWRLKERVKAKDSFTPADVLDIHYDTVAPVKRDIVKLGFHLRDVQQYPPGA